MKIVSVYRTGWTDFTVVYCEDVGKFYVYAGYANLRKPMMNRNEMFVVEANKNFDKTKDNPEKFIKAYQKKYSNLDKQWRLKWRQKK